MVDYFSFDEVMGELEVSEEELRRMVSEGELRAFRSENKMKFRKEDVEVLQTGKESEPTIILPTDEEAAGGTDDISLDLDIEDTAADLTGGAEPEMELDLEPEAEPAAAEPEPDLDLEMEEPEPAVEAADDDDLTAEPEEEAIPTLEAESPDDSGLDDLTLTDDDASIEEADETLVEDDDSDTASTTAPLAFADEGGEEEEEEETATGEITEEGEFVDEEGAVTAPRRGRRGAMAGAGAAATEAPKAGILWTIFLILGFLPCILIIMVFVDDFMLASGVQTQPGAVGGTYEFFGEKFWADGEWKTWAIKNVPAGTVGDDADETDGIPRRTYKQFGTYKDSDAPKTTVGDDESPPE